MFTRVKGANMNTVRTSFFSLGIAALLALGTAAAQTSTGESATMPDQTDSTISQSREAGTRGTLTIPSGTDLSVRTNEAIDSASARAGQKFSGTVEQDAKGSNGEVLIPKGSNAELVIRDVSSGGTTGSSEVALDLHSIDVGGHTYLVSTQGLKQSNDRGLGKNKRTGEYVGGGAALGAIIGAVAGGGKGAVLGGLAGAAAGGATQVLTRGKEVKVPAETTLKFKLDKPLQLRSARSSY
jgi:hypothetical protein